MAIFIHADSTSAAPPTSKYDAGETIDPSCNPGDTNCTVVPPVLQNGTTKITNLNADLIDGIDSTALLFISNNLSELDNAATARTNLGLAIGSNVQAYSAGLQSISGLTTAANKMIYTTASNTYAVTDLTAAARALLDDTTTGAMILTLGLSTGAVLSDNDVTTSIIANGAVTVDKLADSAVTSVKISDGTIANADISNSAAIAFSKLNISKGDITGLGIPESDTTYSAGRGLSLTSTTFSIAPYVLTGSYTGNVGFRGSLTITGALFLSSNATISGTVTATAFEGDGSGLTGITVADGAITTAKLNADAVTTAKILNGTIANADIASDAAIAFSKLNIAKSDITDLGIPESDTDTTYSAGTGLLLNSSTFSISPSVVTKSGSLTNGDVLVWSSLRGVFQPGSGLTPANDSVTTAKILDGTILNADISNATTIDFAKLNITKNDITALGIPESDTTYNAGKGLTLNDTTFDIAPYVLTGAYTGNVQFLGNLNVTGSVIVSSNINAYGTVTATSFAGDASALTGVTPANDSITTSKIVDGTITNDDISDDALIALSKLNLTEGTGISISEDQISIAGTVLTANYSGSVLFNGIMSSRFISTSYTGSVIATITNTSNSANADVMKLELSNIASPGTSNEYLQFFANGSKIGQVRGNGIGGTSYVYVPDTGRALAQSTPGVQFLSSGADYAEYMERVDVKEILYAGQIVGVKKGKISKNTRNADRAMVISANPVVLGNQPPEENAERFSTVAFVGQVYVHVRGPVRSGQYIVASGENDGTGIAKDRGSLSSEDLIVGQAWEEAEGTGEKLVKVGIVPESSLSYAEEVQLLKEEIQSMRAEMNMLRTLLDE